MKNTTASATIFLKQIVSLLRSMAKAKSMAIKSKTEAIRARLVVFSLLKSKKLSLVALSHKIHSLLPGGGGHQEKIKTGHDDHDQADEVSESNAAATANLNVNLNLNLQSQCSSSHQLQLQVPKDDEDLDNCCYPYYYHHHPDGDQYPDLTRSLFGAAESDADHDHELDQLFLKAGDPNASIVDLVRNSKEEGGENFSLEAEIDHVADLFIMKFHKKMRMQKLESFKRYQEMLERSA